MNLSTCLCKQCSHFTSLSSAFVSNFTTLSSALTSFEIFHYLKQFSCLLWDISLQYLVNLTTCLFEQSSSFLWDMVWEVEGRVRGDSTWVTADECLKKSYKYTTNLINNHNIQKCSDVSHVSQIIAMCIFSNDKLWYVHKLISYLEQAETRKFKDKSRYTYISTILIQV